MADRQERGNQWEYTRLQNILTVEASCSRLLDARLKSRNRPTSTDGSSAVGSSISAWYWGIDVSGRALKGEAHFGWALEGRAIQDVWIMPKAADRTGWSDKKMNMYGTTLRVWDSSLQAWQITWTNPAGDHHERQIGRRIGQDVVQIGTRPDGTPTRWTFSEITANSFHWTGEALNPDGRTWRLEGDFRVTRMR